MLDLRLEKAWEVSILKNKTVSPVRAGTASRSLGSPQWLT